MTVQRNYYCNLCSSSKDLLGLYWMSTGLDVRAAQSVEHHICKDCLLSLEPIAEKHRTPDKVEELIEAHTIAPPEPELRLPEGWTSDVVHLHGFWRVHLARNGCNRASLSAPDRATAIRAAQRAVEEMEGGSNER